MKNPAFPVLILEDNPDDLVAIERELCRLDSNFKPYCMTTAKEAFTFLGNADSQQFPKVIILDMKLTDMDGLQFLKEIRSNPMTSSIPVVVFSGYEDEQTIQLAMMNNVSGYIFKPNRLEDLRSILVKITSFWKICEFI